MGINSYCFFQLWSHFLIKKICVHKCSVLFNCGNGRERTKKGRESLKGISIYFFQNLKSLFDDKIFFVPSPLICFMQQVFYFYFLLVIKNNGKSLALPIFLNKVFPLWDVWLHFLVNSGLNRLILWSGFHMFELKNQSFQAWSDFQYFQCFSLWSHCT